jgi:hypothetical protein
MTIYGMTIFAETSSEQAVAQNARQLVDERRTGSRKHFLDAYAEHLEALRCDRSSK